MLLLLLAKQPGLLGCIEVVVGLAEEFLLPKALNNGIDNITDHRLRLLDAVGKLFIQLVLMEETLNYCA